MKTETPKPWYEALYESFPDYDREPYTQNTEAEVNFLLAKLPIPDPDVRLLDVGCGTGRHSIALARAGFSVTGVDLSEELLQQAEAKVGEENLPVSFEQGDARELDFEEQFHAALMLCEGGFSLVETDAMDREILAGIFRALKPGGRLFFTAPNALCMLADLENNPGFNPCTLREEFTIEYTDQEGNFQPLACSQRYYTCPELKAILETLGYEEIYFFAVRGEGYDWTVDPSPDHFEFGVSAVKPAC